MDPSQYIGKTCPFCQSILKPGSEIVVCSACGIPHHLECWRENGGCTTYGCSRAASYSPGHEISVPESIVIDSEDLGESGHTDIVAAPRMDYRSERSDTPILVIVMIIIAVGLTLLFIFAGTKCVPSGYEGENPARPSDNQVLIEDGE